MQPTVEKSPNRTGRVGGLAMILWLALVACDAPQPPSTPPELPPTDPDPRSQHIEQTERLPVATARTVWV